MGDTDFHQNIDLSDQIAIVTGGGRGLGRVYAEALARAGAAVAVVARSADQLAETVTLIEGAGGQASAHPADVTDRLAVEQLVDTVEQQLGAVDLLVNNAGIAGPGNGPIWEADVDGWWRCMDVNLRGPFLCARSVLPSMIARRRGRIINVSSGAGLHPMRNMSPYVVSKTALIRLTENLAVETEEYGISVFAIHPGTVRTPMWETALVSPDAMRWMPWARNIFEKERDNPPELAAQLVLLLASGEADALSGCFISIHDDVAQMVSRADEIKANELHTLRLRT
jgi:NAD(P)-dependent dehydrogenase (short-subunit alcohol dehydrogenase family)